MRPVAVAVAVGAMLLAAARARFDYTPERYVDPANTAETFVHTRAGRARSTRTGSARPRTRGAGILAQHRFGPRCSRARRSSASRSEASLPRQRRTLAIARAAAASSASRRALHARRGLGGGRAGALGAINTGDTR